VEAFASVFRYALDFSIITPLHCSGTVPDEDLAVIRAMAACDESVESRRALILRDGTTTSAFAVAHVFNVSGVWRSATTYLSLLKKSLRTPLHVPFCCVYFSD